MSDPKRNPFQKQGSLSHLEQSMKIIPTPPQAAPVTIYPGPKAGLVNLSKADLEIASRLEKLRSKNVEVPSEEEMASRLAKLKGLPTDHYSKPSIVYQPPDRRTCTEKSDDLLNQILQEVNLDAKVPRPEAELETRLARLRGAPAPAAPTHTHTPTPRVAPSLSPAAPIGSIPSGGDEVSDLLKEFSVEVEGAQASLKSLKEDKDLLSAIKEASKKQKKRKKKEEEEGSDSDGEKFSASDTEEGGRKGKEASPESVRREREEVERIVAMYTRKEEERKKRRKKKKGEEEEDFDSDELDLSTSESEKLSDSDSDSD